MLHTTLRMFDRKRLQYPYSSVKPEVTCKAIDVKNMVFWMSEFAANMEKGGTVDVLLAAASAALASFVNLCECSPMFVSDEVAAQMVEEGNTYLLCHAALRKQVEKQRFTQSLFLARPKMHRFQCLTLRRLQSGSRLNPRVMSCFLDESFIGPIAKLTRVCHESTVGEQTLLRWQLIVFSRWKLLQ